MPEKRCFKKEIWRNSRSLLWRLTMSWFATQNWLDWRPLQLSITEKLEKSHWTNQEKKAPMKLRSDFRKTFANMHLPWFWRRATWTNSPWPIPNVASVVLMLAVEWTLAELKNSSKWIPSGSWNERHQRTRRLVEDASSPTCPVTLWHFFFVAKSTHSPFMNCQKKVIHLLRLGKHVHREDDGANEFWRIKDNLQEHFLVIIGLTTRGRKSMARGGGSKKMHQYCTVSSGATLYSRTLQSQSGRSLIDRILQDNVVFPSGFFSSTCIMSDVQSICIPSSIRDWHLEVKI